MTKQSSQQTSQLDDAFKKRFGINFNSNFNYLKKHVAKKDNRIFFSKRNTWDSRMHLSFLKNKKELATFKNILEVIVFKLKIVCAILCKKFFLNVVTDDFECTIQKKYIK